MTHRNTSLENSSEHPVHEIFGHRAQGRPPIGMGSWFWVSNQTSEQLQQLLRVHQRGLPYCSTFRHENWSIRGTIIYVISNTVSYILIQHDMLGAHLLFDLND